MKHTNPTLINTFADLQEWIDEAPGRSIRITIKENHYSHSGYPSYTFVIAPAKDYHIVNTDYHYEIHAGEVVGNVVIKFTNVFSGDSVSLDMNSLENCERVCEQQGGIVFKQGGLYDTANPTRGNIETCVHLVLQEGEYSATAVFDSWHQLSTI